MLIAQMLLMILAGGQLSLICESPFCRAQSINVEAPLDEQMQLLQKSLLAQHQHHSGTVDVRQVGSNSPLHSSYSSNGPVTITLYKAKHNSNYDLVGFVNILPNHDYYSCQKVINTLNNHACSAASTREVLSPFKRQIIAENAEPERSKLTQADVDFFNQGKAESFEALTPILPLYR